MKPEPEVRPEDFPCYVDYAVACREQGISPEPNPRTRPVVGPPPPIPHSPSVVSRKEFEDLKDKVASLERQLTAIRRLL